MTKTILITGATDGIGLETAKRLIHLGHTVLLHGRNPSKLEDVAHSLSSLAEGAELETYVADLAELASVEAFADEVAAKHTTLDVLINNAGVFTTSNPVDSDGFDLRFLVNTIAPYLLTKRLLPLLGESSRVVNLSSAAQAPVSVEALLGKRRLDDNQAYAQSKLAITMWSQNLAATRGDKGPVVIAVNPGSFLGSKMVKEAYGREGRDLGIGADILIRAAIDEEFASASGRYFDNDSGRFASPHPDAMNAENVTGVVNAIEAVLAMKTNS